MTVNFKFDYVLNLHDKNSYINYIERDGMNDEEAYKKSSFNVNKRDIKDIAKTSDGFAVLRLKNKFTALITTLEEYEDVIEVMRKADLAVDIMHQEKIYIFDEFEVDDDELTVCDSWCDMRDEEREQLNID